jgi:hypothetical protein
MAESAGSKVVKRSRPVRAGTKRSVLARIRRDDGTISERTLADVDVDAFTDAAPWRTFRWYRGQRHYSGAFWSSTEQDHVIYESRLELARLLFADFDSSVSRIVAQPFFMTATIDGVQRKHVPDFLLVTDSGSIVVDVKPHHRLNRTEVSSRLAWCRAAVEARGWRYEVWSEPPPVQLENVRFLAGYRREWLFDPSLLAALRTADLDGVPLGRASDSVPNLPAVLVRPAVLHLVWRQHFNVDLDRPLGSGHVLRRAR